MRRRASVAALLAVAAILPAAPSRADEIVASGDAYVRRTGSLLSIGNDLIERRWSLGDLATSATTRTTGGGTGSWLSESEFTTAPGSVTSEQWSVASWSATSIESGGVELRIRMKGLVPYTIERVARVLPGVAAIRMETIVHAGAAPVPLAAYTLERLTEAAFGPRDGRAINFSGGADWRDAYDYRSDTTGRDFDANAEWFETGDGELGLLMQRRNYLSSRMRWSGGTTAEAAVDLAYDKVYLGPFEEDRPEGGHPPAAPARTRVVAPFGTLALEPVIVAMGSDSDDLAWQAHRMLMSDVRDYPRTINFNTDRVRGGPFEIGARDGVGFPQFQDLWPVAKSLGVETFVLDDGWQLYNGDWTAPDAARYPDGLEPVRDILEANGMRLGLWMAPGSFHPHSQSWNAHPEATCLPVGAGTAAYNAVLPDDGSNAAGIGIWDFNAPLSGEFPRYRDKLAAEIAQITASLRPSEFKFDFLVWIDCQFGSLYEQRDAFFEEIAALGERFGGTGFGMDETNDFRGFPYESMLHGPTWFQNGNPPQDAVLHNVWTMAPYVPGFTIGQAATIRPGDTAATIDEKMAAALAYHMTFWTDIRELETATAVTDRVRLWTDFAKQHRMTNGFAYPLLSDPLGRGTWSGLQPWDADANRGMAMLYRLGAPSDTQTVAFRGLSAGDTYRLTDVTPTGTPFVVGEFPGSDLRIGIPLTIAAPNGVRILTIEPA